VKQTPRSLLLVAHGSTIPDKRSILPVDYHAPVGTCYKVTVTLQKCLPGGTVEDKEEEPRTTVHIVSVPVVSRVVEEALSEAVMEVQKLLLEETDSESEDENELGSVSDPE